MMASMAIEEAIIDAVDGSSSFKHTSFMYLPSLFKESDTDTLLKIMQEYSFATLVSQSDHGIQANHFPIHSCQSDGKVTLSGHMSRANPQWQTLEAQDEVLVIFQGPHAYVSPSWYAPGTHVPTWNYAAIHAYGKATLLTPQKTYDDMQSMVNHYEANQTSPWNLSLPESEKKEMLSAIVGFKIEIARLEGKLKLNQNRTREDRLGVIAALESSKNQIDQKVACLMKKYTFT